MANLSVLSRFKKEIIILFRSYMDRRTPWWVKLFGILAVVYIISPIDFISDFAPVIGWVDDVTLAIFTIALMGKIVPREVLDYHRAKFKNPKR